MGVTKVGDQKYRARYSENGQRINVGTYPTRKMAEEALEASKRKNGMEYEKTPAPEEFAHRPPKPTLKERVVIKWRSIKASLEKRNLI